MLRSLGSHKRPFGCWQCLTKAGYANSQADSSILKDRRSARRFLSTTSDVQAEVQISRTAGPVLSRESLATESAFRERLRRWDLENNDEVVPIEIPFDHKVDVHNGIHSRPSRLADTEEADSIIYIDKDHEEVAEAYNERSFLIPGDLVDLPGADGATRELAIFIRQIGHQYQFYTRTGGWAHRTSTSISIFFPNFVGSEDLDAIRPYLPQEVVEKDLVNKINRIRLSVSRKIGKPLLQKMADFMKEAQAAFLTASSAFEKVYDNVADDFNFTHPTLLEIAEKAFQGVISRNADGTFSAPALFALHEYLLVRDERFQGADLKFRTDPQYEVYPRSYSKAIVGVVGIVRGYTAYPRNPGNEETQVLENFVATARKLIDASRNNRQFTPYGSLGPFFNGSGTLGRQMAFGTAGSIFVRFLEAWAGMNSFSKSSYLNGIGSTVLRAIGRYGIEDVDLGKRTAWTCLKEMGAIAPWTTVAEYRLRVGTQNHNSKSLASYTPKEGFIEDQMQTYRKDWGDLPVFCVDDIGAHEVDDGISIQRADHPGEYWVHIHIADPAAHLDPKGQAATAAKARTETYYLPQFVTPMLDSETVMNKLSLQSGSPTLTFSSKINLAGEILESTIEPGHIRNVIYVTYDTFNKVGAGSTPKDVSSHIIGSSSGFTSDKATRALVSEVELSEEQQKYIKLLHQIANSRLKRQEGKGIMNFNAGKPSVSATLPDGELMRDPMATKKVSRNGQLVWDPAIRLKMPEVQDSPRGSTPNAVACFMQVAGQVAANWCYERGIPIPYRLTRRNPYTQDPREFFHEHLLPTIEKDEQPSMDLLLQYFSLVGAAQVSTTPGPHVSLGLDMYTRCTSPLRRYLDIVVHWQIQAALREEHRTGHSLIDNTKDDIFPFSKTQLDQVIDRAVRAEKRLKRFSKDAETEWLLQFLLRKWKFSKSGLPTPLCFTVTKVYEQNGFATGLLAPYLIPGVLRIPEWTQPADIKSGDHFEVEIFDLDIHGIRLNLDAVRSMSSDEMKAATIEWKSRPSHEPDIVSPPQPLSEARSLDESTTVDSAFLDQIMGAQLLPASGSRAPRNSGRAQLVFSKK